MRALSPCDPLFSLDSLADKICQSSNFRFNWQFFNFEGIDPKSGEGARWAIESMIATPELHRFLRDSFRDMYEKEFRIDPLNKQSVVVPCTGEFEVTLAAAAADRLGAYSSWLTPPKPADVETIKQLFGSAGAYRAFELHDGPQYNRIDRAKDHRYREHHFTNWFYSVAWDWCFVVTWQTRKTLWIGCLTDTD